MTEAGSGAVARVPGAPEALQARGASGRTGTSEAPAAAAQASEGQQGSPGERFTFFWKSDSPFSQWYSGAPFEVDGRQYVTAEQYMMAGKALLFGDEEIAVRIMATDSPSEQKRLSKKVRNFDESVWAQNRERIVLEGNRAKFSTNPAARAALLATAGTTLVEASPVDRIWGIGLAEGDPRAAQRATWRGLNLLGRVLTQLREELLAELAPPQPEEASKQAAAQPAE